MSILELRHLGYTYEGQQRKSILQQVDYSFEKGTFYAILGKSGAGKSTLLSLLAGLDDPHQGQIIVNGKDIQEKGTAHHRKKQISLVFQNYNLIDYLTPLENLHLVNTKATPEMLLQFGLEEGDIHRPILNLSGGQQQRVAIARALATDAPILLADEPTGNLDQQTASDVISILKRAAHAEMKCVIVVTHSLHLAKEADVVLELKNRNLKFKKN